MMPISGSTILFVPVCCWEQWSDALTRCSVMSSDRFQKLFAVVTWYLVCLVFNLFRFVWGGVPKAVFVMVETGKDGVFFLHIYRSQSVHFIFKIFISGLYDLQLYSRQYIVVF
jgi:hypothetical protein